MNFKDTESKGIEMFDFHYASEQETWKAHQRMGYKCDRIDEKEDLKIIET